MKERVGLIQSKPGVGSIEDDLGKFVEQYLNGKLPGKRQRVTMTQTVQVKLDGVQRTFQAYAHALAHASSSLMPPPRPASSSPHLRHGRLIRILVLVLTSFCLVLVLTASCLLLLRFHIDVPSATISGGSKTLNGTMI